MVVGGRGTEGRVGRWLRGRRLLLLEEARLELLVVRRLLERDEPRLGLRLQRRLRKEKPPACKKKGWPTIRLKACRWGGGGPSGRPASALVHAAARGGARGDNQLNCGDPIYLAGLGVLETWETPTRPRARGWKAWPCERAQRPSRLPGVLTRALARVLARALPLPLEVRHPADSRDARAGRARMAAGPQAHRPAGPQAAAHHRRHTPA